MLSALGCTTAPPQRSGEERPGYVERLAPVAATSTSPAVGPTPVAPAPAEPVAAPPAVPAERALEVVFGETAGDAARACLTWGDDMARITCLLQLRFDADAEAKESALALFREGGIVTGVNPELEMDGGWRGVLRLVPELPVGPHRRHVAWVAAAHRDLDSFFGNLEPHAKKPIRYRWRALELRFFRSVGRTTPSAYAEGWAIAYNVSGSLHGSGEAVRETWFHEVFHLNDQDHDGWSEQHLTALYDTIVAGCTTAGRLSTPCLTPFTPNDTMVRGGTYYAFQPGNGVGEYAAELALRYYREHRDHFAGRPPAKRPFKCGPDPSAEAWRRLADEFFGGVDRIPPC